MSFFSKQNIIVLGDCRLFKSKSNDESDDKSAQWENALLTMSDDNKVLLICRDGMDKRRKLFKSLQKSACVIEVEPPEPRHAFSHFETSLRKLGYQLDTKATQLLQTAFESASELSWGMLENEKDKLILYKDQNKAISSSDIEQVFSASFAVSGFKLCDMLAMRRTEQALAMLKTIVENGENIQKLLGLIAWKYRMLLIAREYIDEGREMRELSKKLATHPAAVEGAVQGCKQYSADELRNIICELALLDANLKNGNATVETLFAIFTAFMARAGKK